MTEGLLQKKKQSLTAYGGAPFTQGSLGFVQLFKPLLINEVCQHPVVGFANFGFRLRPAGHRQVLSF